MLPLIEAGAYLDSQVVLARYAIALRAEGCSENTVELRTQTPGVAARRAECSVLALSTDDIREFLAAYTNANTRATHFVSVRRFSRWLVAEGIRSDDPTARIKPPPFPRRIPRPCTTPALWAMLAVATPREEPIVLLAAREGLRAGEIARVRGEHFDHHAGVLYVLGKGNVEAYLPIHEDVAEVAHRMPATDWWFPSPRRAAGHMTPEHISTIVRSVCLRAEVPPHGAHRLRHRYGTDLARSGVDAFTLRDLMRHASMSTTQGYIEVADEARHEAIRGLPARQRPWA